VHYTGWLEAFNSAHKFDSSYDRDKPLVFKVGTKKVIAGSAATFKSILSTAF
jgi:FKBP-type peptidyl-prolyl cis-trans isomerase